MRPCRNFSNSQILEGEVVLQLFAVIAGRISFRIRLPNLAMRPPRKVDIQAFEDAGADSVIVCVGGG